MSRSGSIERRSQTRIRQVAALAPDWKALLDDAANEADLVRVTREYLATWTPQEMFALPEQCRPGQIKGGEDISFWAFELARAHCSDNDDPVVAGLVAKMMTFFSHASDSLAKLMQARRAAESDEDS